MGDAWALEPRLYGLAERLIGAELDVGMFRGWDGGGRVLLGHSAEPEGDGGTSLIQADPRDTGKLKRSAKGAQWWAIPSSPANRERVRLGIRRGLRDHRGDSLKGPEKTKSW
uniref:RAMA domain-containing protein n=1 Tax=Knipowitschia caucasica TaxID=637954 RepID=A0AAV2LFE7_KNICA